MSEEDYAKVKQAFSIFDTNSDGTISVQELRAILSRGANPMLSNEEVDEVISAFDASGDGKLSIKEFQKACFSMTDEEAEALEAKLELGNRDKNTLTVEEGGPEWLSTALEHLTSWGKSLWDDYSDDIKELAVENLQNVVWNVAKGRFTGDSAKDAALTLLKGAREAAASGKSVLEEKLKAAFDDLKNDLAEDVKEALEAKIKELDG
mmetsp:Transcript_79685/g.158362  ORF Transcript_79685/g.158362 Transcript_79685/m.158362 type:complete len:207 (-) Transcript_79685:289-909(-)